MTVILDTLPQVVDVVRLRPSSGAAPGPARFSQSVRHGSVVYISGQTATDTHGKTSYEKQIKQVLEALDAQLAAAGTCKANLLSVRVYLKDINKGAAPFNKAWQEWVSPAHLPARTTVEAALIDPRLLVEVEAVAVVPAVPLLSLPAVGVPEWATKLHGQVAEQLIKRTPSGNWLAVPKGWAPAQGQSEWFGAATEWASKHAAQLAGVAVVALAATAALAATKKA